MNSIASVPLICSTPSRVTLRSDLQKQGSKPLLPRQLRDILRRFQAGKQARSCGTTLKTPAVLATVPTSGKGWTWAVVGGESRCHSPRCVICRCSLMSRRADEIKYCIDQWMAEAPGNQVSMITFTAPHYRADFLEDLLGDIKTRTGIRGAMALSKQRGLWRRKVKHYVCGLEITQGRNGWHCHFHILVFHEADLDLEEWYQSWRRACLQAGLPAPSKEHGLVIQSAESAAKYMAKWSIASEATGGNHKAGKNGNRAIFQIEQAAAADDVEAQYLLIEYNNKTLRARWHTFSRSLMPWRKQWLQERHKPNPVLVFGPEASQELTENPELARLVAELAGQNLADVTDIGSALRLEAEVPEYPEVVWVAEPSRRARMLYDRALDESRYEDAAKLWAEIEFYQQAAIQSAAYQASDSGGYRPTQKANVRTFHPP